jgi:hypothetical protein
MRADWERVALAAIEDALLRVDGRVSDRAIEVALNAVEPLIRADEREHGAHTRQEGWLNTESHRKAVLAQLRAKVEALPTVKVDGYLYVGMVWYQDVLDLIDGSSP